MPTLEVFAAMHGAAFSTQGRPLTQRELDLARPMFRESLRYEEVRIVSAAFANSPTTLGPNIRIGLSLGMDPEDADRTLIHELTHVWQYQTRGMRYVSNSLCHQAVAALGKGSRNAAYELVQLEVQQAGSIDRLSAEKQATLVERWFADLYFSADASTPGVPRVPVRSEPVCAAMLEQVRAARPLPRGYVLEEAAWGAGMGSFRLREPATSEWPMLPIVRIEF